MDRMLHRGTGTRVGNFPGNCVQVFHTRQFSFVLRFVHCLRSSLFARLVFRGLGGSGGAAAGGGGGGGDDAAAGGGGLRRCLVRCGQHKEGDENHCEVLLVEVT